MIGEGSPIPSNAASSGASISATTTANQHMEDSQVSDEPEEQQQDVQTGCNGVHVQKERSLHLRYETSSTILLKIDQTIHK